MHPRSLEHIMTRMQNKIDTMMHSSRNKNTGGKSQIRHHQNNKISYNSYVKSSLFDFKMDVTSLDDRLELAKAKCSGSGQVIACVYSWCWTGAAEEVAFCRAVAIS